MHQEIAALGGADQAADCGLPFLEILLGFRQLRDVTGRLLEGSELAAIGEGDRILEGPGRIRSSKARDQSATMQQPGRADRRLFAGLGVSAVYDNIIAEIIIRSIGASLKIGQVNLLGRGQ